MTMLYYTVLYGQFSVAINHFYTPLVTMSRWSLSELLFRKTKAYTNSTLHWHCMNLKSSGRWVGKVGNGRSRYNRNNCAPNTWPTSRYEWCVKKAFFTYSVHISCFTWPAGKKYSYSQHFQNRQCCKADTTVLLLLDEFHSLLCDWTLFKVDIPLNRTAWGITPQNVNF